MRFLTLVLLLLTLVSVTHGHSILLMVDLESDSTIYIEGGLSTGRIPAGATITVAEKASGRPLWQGAMPDSGNVTLPLPEKPYTVSLKLSEGHSVTKSGPLKKSNTVADSASLKEKPQEGTPPKEITVENSSTKIVTILLLVVAVIIGFVFGFKRK